MKFIFAVAIMALCTQLVGNYAFAYESKDNLSCDGLGQDHRFYYQLSGPLEVGANLSFVTNRQVGENLPAFKPVQQWDLKVNEIIQYENELVIKGPVTNLYFIGGGHKDYEVHIPFVNAQKTMVAFNTNTLYVQNQDNLAMKCRVYEEGGLQIPKDQLVPPVDFSK